MKKYGIIALAMLASVLGVTGCEKKQEENVAKPTETYVEENETEVVYHDTENVDFRIALVKGDMSLGFHRLAEDAKLEQAANQYRFYEYENFDKFRSLFECGTIDIATLTLEDALEVYREDPEFLCLLAINSVGENSYGVTVVTTQFAKTYPSALKVFIEEMSYSAREATCIMGGEMRAMIEEQLIAREEELPGDDFYYPLPEVTVTGEEDLKTAPAQVTGAEEAGKND